MAKRKFTITLVDEQIKNLIEIVGGDLDEIANRHDDDSPAQVRALLLLFHALTDGNFLGWTSERPKSQYQMWLKEALRLPQEEKQELTATEQHSVWNPTGMQTKQEQTKELIGEVKEMIDNTSASTLGEQMQRVQLALLLRIAKALEQLEKNERA